MCIVQHTYNIPVNLRSFNHMGFIFRGNPYWISNNYNCYFNRRYINFLYDMLHMLY